jgi:hypothetical protein
MMSNGRLVYDTVVAGVDPVPEDDVEAAYNDWRADLMGSETPGAIRAFRIPLDDQGHASHSAKNQIRLGAWPIDAYTFDELCEKIKVEFMLPNEKTMAVRFLGTLTGKGGVSFNKLVVMQRANSVTEAVNTAAGTGSVAEILQAMQNSQAATLRMIQEMTASGRLQNDPMQGMMQFAAMYKMMMEPMAAMMAGRAPGSTADPISSMKGMLEAMTMLDDLRGDRSGGRGGSETAEIIKAVAGVGTPLLQLAVQANAHKPPVAPRPRLNPPRPPNPAPVPTAAPVATGPGHTPPVRAPTAPVGVDLSRPSPLPPGSLAPGPDIQQPSSPTRVETSVNFAETKARIDAFVEIARAGNDPVAVADTFFEQEMLALDDDPYAELAANIDDPEFVTHISIFNPGVMEHRAFFERLRERLSERLDLETQAAGEDLPPD